MHGTVGCSTLVAEAVMNVQPVHTTSRPPLVAIVGRPNVGKSSLFNRLLGRRRALVEDLPGTTRDRVYGDVEWRGHTLRLVDTGGLEAPGEGPFAPLVRRQIEQAIAEADVILFVVDAREGVTAADLDIAQLLRRTDKPVLLVANKADNLQRELEATQFYELGFGDPLPVSAYHDLGVAELLDEILALLPQTPAPVTTETGLRLAIIGRPNVGKSALLNAIVGDERVIVSEIPGTTRDVIDTTISYAGQTLTLLDTAGIRRAGRIERGVERHSVERARAALARADVALCVMDATEPATAQDTHIVGMAEEAHTGIVLVLNKMDLLPLGQETRQRLTALVRARFKFVPWAPIAFVSAKTGEGVQELLALTLAVGRERTKRVPTGELNRLIRRVMAEHAPPSVQGKRLKVLYVTQAEVSPPTFVFFVNDAALLHFSYERYLENRLREAFGFQGTAIRLVFRSRPGSPGPRAAGRGGEGGEVDGRSANEQHRKAGADRTRECRTPSSEPH
jgi:GTP-binding protein